MSTRYTDVLTEIRDAVEMQNGAWEIYKKTLDEREERLKDRIEELESRAGSPGKTGRPLSESLQRKHVEVFTDWIRKPTESQRILTLENFQSVEMKDVTVGTGSAGGFALPEQIAREIEMQEKKLSPVRRLVKVVQVGTSDYKELVNIRGESSGWVAETGTRTATLTPSLREIVPTNGELYAYPQASEWSLDDLFFDVQAWLVETIALEFALQEGEAVIRGNGTSKPTGMLNTVPTNVDDFGSPLRAAAVYQFIASSASPDAVTADSLIDCLYKLNSIYRSDAATWAMNSATMASIRKLKASGTGEYLFQPSLIAGQPDMLLGYPVEIWEQMDDVGANKHPVAFGSFRRGYVLADRVGLRVLKDPYTNPGFVRFYIRRREGGIVLNNNAIKWIKTT